MDYFIRRFLLMIPTFFGITIIIFTLLQSIPGGPVEQEVMKLRGASEGEAGGGLATDAELSPEEMDMIRKKYDFDLPIYKRYLKWIWGVFHLDFGESWKYKRPVWEVIRKRMKISIVLGLLGFVLSYAICIPLGVFKALRHHSPFDVISSIIVFLGYSVPGWALGAVLLVLLGGGTFDVQVFPLRNWYPDDWEMRTSWGRLLGVLHHCTLPIFCYMLGMFASTTMLMKNSLMENLGQDYVRTAFAKGLPEKRAIFVHALRNSMIPLATGLGHVFGLILAGSFLIEKVFNIDGMGYLNYTSLVERDYPVALGILVISSFLILLGNILSDFLLTIFDPRIKFK